MKCARFITIVLFGILFSGCGSKKLRCTKVEESEFGRANEKQMFIFENNKISSYEAKMVINLNDDYNDYADLLLESLESPFEEFKDKNGITYNTSKGNDKISIKIKANYNKLDEESRKSLGINDNPSFNKIKKSLEDDGYKCK